MKKLALTLALAATFATGAIAPAVHAQAPAPSPAAAAPDVDREKIKAALQSLGLTPKQKMDAVRIMKAAKDGNQDKMTTLKQLEGVLTPDQMNKLKAAVSAQH